MNKTKMIPIGVCLTALGYVAGFMQQEGKINKIGREKDFTPLAITVTQTPILLDIIDLIREEENDRAEALLIDLAKGYLVAHQDFERKYPGATLNQPSTFSELHQSTSALTPELEPVAAGQRR